MAVSAGFKVLALSKYATILLLSPLTLSMEWQMIVMNSNLSNHPLSTLYKRCTVCRKPSFHPIVILLGLREQARVLGISWPIPHTYNKMIQDFKHTFETLWLNSWIFLQHKTVQRRQAKTNAQQAMRHMAGYSVTTSPASRSRTPYCNTFHRMIMKDETFYFHGRSWEPQRIQCCERLQQYWAFQVKITLR
jgi:hypothetical protein